MVCPTCNPLAAIIFSGCCDFSPSKTIVVRRHFAFGGGSCAAAPAASVKNLMLREEVVDAVRQGRFHVWAVRTVDEGIEILTGAPAGVRRADGTWEPGTVNARVDQRLRDYAQRLKDFGRAVGFAETRERKPAEIGPQAPRFQSWWAAIRRLLSWR